MVRARWIWRGNTYAHDILVSDAIRKQKKIQMFWIMDMIVIKFHGTVLVKGFAHTILWCITGSHFRWSSKNAIFIYSILQLPYAMHHKHVLFSCQVPFNQLVCSKFHLISTHISLLRNLNVRIDLIIWCTFRYTTTERICYAEFGYTVLYTLTSKCNFLDFPTLHRLQMWFYRSNLNLKLTWKFAVFSQIWNTAMLFPTYFASGSHAHALLWLCMLLLIANIRCRNYIHVCRMSCSLSLHSIHHACNCNACIAKYL